MTKKEAEEKLEIVLLKFHEQRGIITCPLSGFPCVQNCECIEKPWISPRGTAKPGNGYRVHEWQCNNYMFHGNE